MSYFAIPNLNVFDYTKTVEKLVPYIRQEWYSNRIWVVGIPRRMARELADLMPDWVEVIL